MVEPWTPEREFGGSIPNSALLCPFGGSIPNSALLCP